MFFGVLGPLAVLDDSASEAVPVRAAMHRGVLALLLADANKVVARDTLAEALWDGQVPSTARTTLAAYVARLRAALGPEAGARIRTQNPGYLISVEPEEYDVLQAAELERQARAAAEDGDWERAGALVSRALGLWRGEPYQDVPVVTLHRHELPTLDAARLRLAELEVTALRNSGRPDESIARLADLVAQHPIREQFSAQLMTALAGRGRRAEALEVYRQARRALRDQLGLDPGPELEQAHQSVLNGSPAAATTAVPVAGDARAAGRAMPVPRQLPLAPRFFTGREAELDALSSAQRSQDGAIVALIGPGGIGKTATALRWAHQHAADFPDGQLFVDLRGFDPGGRSVSAKEAIRGSLAALGVSGKQIPDTHADRVALYRTITAGLRLLVVLDNAADGAHVRDLLPAGPACLTVVTSRDRLTGLVTSEGAEPVRFDPLSDGESLNLLTTRLGRERTEADAGGIRELVQQVAGLPLALAVIAARLALQPELNATELAERLRDGRRLLAELGTEETQTDLRAVFSWSYRRLSREAASVFVRLGLHPGPSISVDAAACLSRLPVERADAALAELVDAHLLTVTAEGRFALHDLLRLYAAAQAVEELEHEKIHDARTRMFDHYLGLAHAAHDLVNPSRTESEAFTPTESHAAPDFENATEAYVWFDRERDVLTALCPEALTEGFYEHAWRLPWILAVFLDRRGEWCTMVDLLELQVEATRRIGEPFRYGWTLCDSAYALWRDGDFEPAAARLDEARAVFKEIGHDNGLSRAERLAALVCNSRGDHAEELEHAERALEMARQEGNERSEAHALIATARANNELERHKEALELGLEALETYARLGLTAWQVSALEAMALACDRMGESEQALAFYERAADLLLLVDDRYTQASVYARIAAVHESVGRTKPADEFRAAALAIVEDLELSPHDPLRSQLEQGNQRVHNEPLG